MKTVLIVVGTRPEAIKMAPIIKTFEQDKTFKLKVCVTAQHRQMLDQVLELFDIQPDYDLDVMQNNQTAIDCFNSIMQGLSTIIQDIKPDAVFVHGDTTTTIASAMTAFYHKVPVMHVEAGLRTYNIQSPWPEEAHRQMLSNIAHCHFAPSKHTAQNLYNEHVSPDTVFITGNTVIDALKMIQQRLNGDGDIAKATKKQFDYLDFDKPIVLLTVHRHENIGDGIKKIIKAVQKLSDMHPQTQFVIPMNLNPIVRQPILEKLDNLKNVSLIEPLDYLPFVYLMSHCTVILTDSGGIQEEAPALGVPVLVLRNTTERQEVLETGAIKLIGTHAPTIVSETTMLLDSPKVRKKMIKDFHPYGDGTASIQILEIIKSKWWLLILAQNNRH